MAKEIFWGLTSRDFEQGLWNSVNQNMTALAGFGSAILTYYLFKSLFTSHELRKNAPKDTESMLRFVGFGVGIGASILLANRVSFATIASEKAFKFLVINLVIGATGSFFGKAGAIVAFMCSGGTLGYIGRNVLYLTGIIGACAAMPVLTKINTGHW